MWIDDTYWILDDVYYWLDLADTTYAVTVESAVVAYEQPRSGVIRFIGNQDAGWWDVQPADVETVDFYFPEKPPFVIVEVWYGDIPGTAEWCGLTDPNRWEGVGVDDGWLTVEVEAPALLRVWYTGPDGSIRAVYREVRER